MGGWPALTCMLSSKTQNTQIDQVGDRQKYKNRIKLKGFQIYMFHNLIFPNLYADVHENSLLFDKNKSSFRD